MPSSDPRVLRHVASAAALVLLSACATPPAPPPAATAVAPSAPAPANAASSASANGQATASAGTAAKPAAAAAPPAVGGPPPFATVTKDARKIEGLLTFWQKDDKVWLELGPQDLAQPFFLSPKLASGIGEAGLFGGLMVGRWAPWGRAQVVEFRRVNNLVQLVARNDQYTAAAGSPEARAVKAAYSDSLLGSGAVASQAHPESKAILVDANAIFVSDMLGLGISLQRQYRQGYAFDARNSAITELRGQAEESMLRVQSHFATSNLATPTPGAPAGAPVPSLPSTLPDARSLFMTVHYSLTRLPAEPMRPRRADPRIGHFTTVVHDFGNDLQRQPRQRYINRWRLDKKDPMAALSEPVKPITFWLDRNIPLKYRDAISRGVLGWNAAFEKIGFKNALVVRQQGDDESFDTLDTQVASIRWMTNAKPLFGAIGPSQVDPRTGEILDADIGMESLSSRSVRAARSQLLSPRSQTDWPSLMQAAAHHGHDPADACHFAELAAEQLAYALDVLDARGDLPPDSPEAEAFVQDYLLDTTLHEVGHTLGLRHNFRSSRVYTDAQLSSAEFTRAHGLAGSVMEYAPINLPLPGQAPSSYFQTVLGPYDYWAIEYAYKPLSAEEEGAELQRMAARSHEPALAYGTDEDNYLGLDPETLVMDLGDDPLLFARKRMTIARDLIQRQERRVLLPTEDYSVLRRSVSYALRDVGRAVGVLTRQIGGLRTLRDFAGSGRDPLLPVPAAVQREALRTLTQEVLADERWRVSPSLARKLSADFMDRSDSGEPVTTDYSVEGMVLDLQRSVLAGLMSDALAARLLDNAGKLERREQVLALPEVHAQLALAVWGDAWRGAPLTASRRELQRDYVNRAAERLLRSTPGSRADGRSVLRAQAQTVLSQLQAAVARPGLDGTTRAHLQECVETLRLALVAPLTRAGA